MGWPTPQEYNEAIQSPRLCFTDAELKQGTVTLTPFGLPKPITGAFASVYQVKCGNRRWAVRCFLREFDDQERRYSAISEHLKQANLTCMVGFQFISRGILVGGLWYPILKMEWIDGAPLNEYISRNLAEQRLFQSLARQWIDLMNSLRKKGIAHGDLQHGNILVSGGALKLIDYDGMYVPALAGLASHEEGHRNYQHPGRTGKEFHSDLDNFSAWIIFSSLSALAIDPSLWKLLNGGDECLLFRREDFEKPRTSKGLQLLEKNGNLQVQALVSHLRSILCRPLSQVPSLEGSILEQHAKPDQSPADSPRTAPRGLPAWLGDHISEPPDQTDLEPLEGISLDPKVEGAKWVFDHLVDDTIAPQLHPLIIQMRDRIALYSFIGLLIFLVAAWATSWVPVVVFAPVILLALAATVAALIVGYRTTNPSEKMKVVQERIAAGRTALSQLESVINLSKLERARLGEPLAVIKQAHDKLPQLRDAEAQRLDRNLALTLDGIETRRRKAEKDYQAAISLLDGEVEQLDQNTARMLEGIEARKRKAKQDEDAETRQCAHGTNTGTDKLVQQLAKLDSEEKAEINQALQKARILHVNVALSRAALTASVVDGIGNKLVKRLRAAGVYCASDVSYDRVRDVPGIGLAKAFSLTEWRQRLEDEAKRSAPSSLSQMTLSRIQDKYASNRRDIDQRITSLKDEERREGQQILQKYTAIRRALESEEQSARRDFVSQRNSLKAKHGNERKRLGAQIATVQQKLDTEVELAKQKHGLEREAAKTRFNQERERLAAEYKVEKTNAAEALKKLNEKLDQLNGGLFQRRLEVRQAERELSRIKLINPVTYLRLVLLPKRVI